MLTEQNTNPGKNKDTEIENAVIQMLRERRSVPFIIVSVKSKFDYVILREEITKIGEKHNIEQILKKEEEEEISRLIRKTETAYFEYREIKYLYDKLQAALHGCDRDIAPEAALRKICDVSDRMFAAKRECQRIEKEAKEEIKAKLGEETGAVFTGFWKQVRGMFEGNRSVARLEPGTGNPGSDDLLSG
jgi:hypothetical protein